MHTMYNNFLRKFEFKDVVYYVPHNCLFWAQLCRLNTLQMKVITRKEKICAYRNELVFMDYPKEMWKHVVQKRRNTYANVYDVI
jgi:hypothetical protein